VRPALTTTTRSTLDDRARPLGRLSSRRTFGHNGSNTCIGWADPDRRIVVAYLTNRLQGGLEGSPHQCAISDAILTACE
jgi:CubicO group peptidase (beta-lactamase class C family)